MHVGAATVGGARKPDSYTQITKYAAMFRSPSVRGLLFGAPTPQCHTQPLHPLP